MQPGGIGWRILGRALVQLSIGSDRASDCEAPERKADRDFVPRAWHSCDNATNASDLSDVSNSVGLSHAELGIRQENTSRIEKPATDFPRGLLIFPMMPICY